MSRTSTNFIIYIYSTHATKLLDGKLSTQSLSDMRTNPSERGELFDRIVEKHTYTEKEARDVCSIIFNAVNHCHTHRITHRDLKPENLLLLSRDSDTNLKIADFGFAKMTPSEDSLTTFCGSPMFVSPEILNKKKYGTKTDVEYWGGSCYVELFY